MANTKISALTSATTPVAGTEVLPIVQSSATVKLAISDLTPGLSTIAVTKGGTGLTSGTSGGVPYYSATTTIASSAALTANALVVGGGSGVAPSTITTGTGVVTALGVNTGSTGAFVVKEEALGTPSSGTVTNLTGTASININGTVGATTPAAGSFTSVTNSGLTTGRVVYTTTSGLLTSSANLLYSGTDLTVYGLTVGRGAGAVATNTVLGNGAFASNIASGNNTIIGYQAGATSTAGAQNTFVGRLAGTIATGSSNVFIGNNSGGSVTSGFSNSILGNFSGNTATLNMITGNNYAIIADGDGNIKAYGNSSNNWVIPTGNVIQGTAAKGFDFSANTPLAGKTSTILNWYEEGTWTPNQGAGLTLVGAFSSTGKYTRVGRNVTVSGTVTGATSVAVTSAGVITTNLPFTVGTAGHGNATNAALTASATVICTGTSVTSAGAIAATGTITFSATYFV